MTNSLQQSISQMYAPRKPERRKGFVELSAELGLERDSIKGRIADIDAEVAKLDEAYTRAVTARANAALDGDRVGPAEAADAYLRGEDVRPGFAVVRAAVPGEEVLVGLRRRKDALLQERGTSTGRLRGIARELRIARLHDAVDLYLTSAEQLGDLWAEIIVSGEELRSHRWGWAGTPSASRRRRMTSPTARRTRMGCCTTRTSCASVATVQGRSSGCRR
ncbi:MAG: hypothetical protein IPN24_18455 [Betaproteobacteria bacterium]|nr:hypothetical protein [Betaproteobacteria bacterium]